MKRGKSSSRLRQRRPSRDKNNTNSSTEGLAGQRIIGLGKSHGPLAKTDLVKIHEAALELLEKTGLSDASPNVVNLVVTAGGKFDARGRLLFPKNLVEAALNGLRRDITLYGRDSDNDMVLSAGAVFVGTGGASPMIFDAKLGKYRESKLLDIYDAARLVDRLTHIHFFSRPVVAGDISDARQLD